MLQKKVDADEVIQENKHRQSTTATSQASRHQQKHNNNIIIIKPTISASSSPDNADVLNNVDIISSCSITDNSSKNKLLHAIDANPPWHVYLLFLLGFQVFYIL